MSHMNDNIGLKSQKSFLKKRIQATATTNSNKAELKILLRGNTCIA